MEPKPLAHRGRSNGGPVIEAEPLTQEAAVMGCSLEAKPPFHRGISNGTVQVEAKLLPCKDRSIRAVTWRPGRQAIEANLFKIQWCCDVNKESRHKSIALLDKYANHDLSFRGQAEAIDANILQIKKC